MISGVCQSAPRVASVHPRRREDAPAPRDEPDHTGSVPYVVAVAVGDLIAVVAAHEDRDLVHESRTGPDAVVELEMNGYRCVVTRLAPRAAADLLPGDDAVGALSPREREVAQMVCAGLTNRAIASVLDISPWTVGTHLRRIFVKLDVTSRAAMVARFLDPSF